MLCIAPEHALGVVQDAYDDAASQASSAGSEPQHINVVHIPILQPMHRIFHCSTSSNSWTATATSSNLDQSLLEQSQSEASLDTDGSCLDLADLVYPCIVQCQAGYAPALSSLGSVIILSAFLCAVSRSEPPVSTCLFLFDGIRMIAAAVAWKQNRLHSHAVQCAASDARIFFADQFQS